jgi:hypothetical protein
MDIGKHVEMGLKPLVHLQPSNSPTCRGRLFTKVNGNKINYTIILLPSALADGTVNVQFNWALATFLIHSIKCLFQ